MYGMRDYRIYSVKAYVDTQDRQEDNLGELTGYSDKYRVERSYTIVAPSEHHARAHIMQREQLNDPKIDTVTAIEIDALILEIGS